MFDSDYIDKKIHEFWYELLGTNNIKFHDNFFRIGGDDLLFKSLLMRIKKEFSFDVSKVNIIDFATIYQQSLAIKNFFNLIYPNIIVPLQKGKIADPIPVFIHPIGGSLFPFMALINKLRVTNTIYGIQDCILFGDMRCFNSLIEQADFYATELQKVTYDRKIILIGYSSGGSIANAMAYHLINRGVQIQHVVMFDSWIEMPFGLGIRNKFKAIIERQFDKIKPYNFFNNQYQINQWLNILWNRMRLVFNYQPKKISINATLFVPKESVPEYTVDKETIEGWSEFLSQVDIHYVSGNHETMLEEQYIAPIVEKLSSILK